MTIDREAVEKALDTGTLWVAIANGNYWVARRNGKTQTWKTRPMNFRIPFKYGFKGHGAFTETDLTHFGAAWPSYYVISDGQPLSRDKR